MRENIISTLSKELLNQPFAYDKDESVTLAKGQQIAYGYAKIENSIAVLSDLRSNKSYIYNGGVAEKLGISKNKCTKELDSIWEEDIFKRIHPDDLIEKHLLELRFFHLLKNMPVRERANYHIISRLRMMDNLGKYTSIQHRMFYVGSCPMGNLWLALCLYNFSHNTTTSEIFDGIIINSVTGRTIKADNDKCKNILSSREKEILQLIEKGKASIEIADVLSISKNTVSRHRQNILEKLRVKNSIEACQIAKIMNLI
ncbi:MAG: LuxR C-terminal-related transcriptional regulator [Tannerella sp.]|jgi:DNA-binding CsgD family transcriptional regulator|nr:LuxR C-terminal-related transcriptional regulator [Tannerella sp.]